MHLAYFMGILLFPTGCMFVFWLYSCHFAISILSFSQFYRAVQDIVKEVAEGGRQEGTKTLLSMTRKQLYLTVLAMVTGLSFWTGWMNLVFYWLVMSGFIDS